MTELRHDIEAQSAITVKPKSSLRLHFDQTGVTPEVLGWKYAGNGTSEDPYIVDFIHDDPKNPQRFPTWRKWLYTFLQAFSVFAVSFSSSGFTGGIRQIMAEFQCAQILATLGVSLFVMGFALGPLLWAPLSETFGRQLLFIITYSGLTVFLAASAGAPNIEALVILRFLAGIFGSSPLTNSGAVIADMFNEKERGLAMSIFAAAPFLGPTMGPIVGGFMGDAAGWRWICGMLAFLCALMLTLVALLVPETYVPVLLRWRADKLSKMTGKVYVSKVDAVIPRKSLKLEIKTSLSRPWVLLFYEPIVLILSVYMAIIYGTLYMMFGAFPIVFEVQRGWSAGVSGLPFISVAVGMFFSLAYCIWDDKRYAAVIIAKGKAAPEDRLPPSIIGSCLLPVGLFWFAWTNGLDMHWIVPIIASSLFGAGQVLVFLSLMNYLIDSYVVFSASVLAASSVIRSVFGAAFPLFTTNMFENLGVHWAASIPAFLALLCVPFPYLFYKYGVRVRMKCKFAAESADVLERIRTNPEAKRGIQVEKNPEQTFRARAVLSENPEEAEDAAWAELEERQAEYDNKEKDET